MRTLAAFVIIIPVGAVPIAPACDRDEHCALLVHRSSVLQKTTATATERMMTTTCDPCKLEKKIRGVQLKIDIFAKPTNWTRPLILMFHGSGETFDNTNPICENLYADGDLVCASLENTKYSGKKIKKEIKVTEVALSYLTQHASAYAINASNIFLYGYSAGGIHLTKFMTNSEDPLRDGILGLMIDSGTPEGYWKDLVKNEKVLPPILMLHCEKDKTMKVENTIDPGIENIKKVNKARNGTDIPLVQYHYMKYTKKSKCKHEPRAHFDSGIDALKTYMDQMLSIYNGADADPFEGIASEVEKKEKPW